MILEEATFEAFGYYARDLKPQSHKHILAACDDCGNIREMQKQNYHAFCGSCAQKGDKGFWSKKHLSDKTRAKMSKARKGIFVGKKNPMYGKHHNADACIKMSKAKKGKHCSANTRVKISKALKGDKHQMHGRTGDKHPKWRGGKKICHARSNAKRKRQLGYTLLMPLKDSEVGHHVTNEYVIGIPAEVHQKLSGGSRKKHRIRVLQWLKANDRKKYKKVLCILAKEPFPKCSNSVQKNKTNSKVPDRYTD